MVGCGVEGVAVGWGVGESQSAYITTEQHGKNQEKIDKKGTKQ